MLRSEEVFREKGRKPDAFHAVTELEAPWSTQQIAKEKRKNS